MLDCTARFFLVIDLLNVEMQRLPPGELGSRGGCHCYRWTSGRAALHDDDVGDVVR
jgi:hypothetical protein